MIMEGTGIDPTGATDSADAINAFILVAKDIGGIIYIPKGLYMIQSPIVLYSGLSYRGEAAFTDYNGVTRFIAGDAFPLGGTAFTPDYNPMFKTVNWDVNQGTGWMHTLTIHDICINGNYRAEVGLAVHRLGEVSGLFNVLVDRCTDKQVWATGAHAPFHMQNCTINRGVNGIHFDTHPSGLGGTGCSVCILGLSGDISTGAFVRISGSQQVTIVGIKSENHTGATILIDGSGASAAAASLTLTGGYSNDPSATELIRIDGTARPSIMCVGFESAGSGVLIRDNVLSKTVDKQRNGAGRSGIVAYGSHSSLISGGFALGKSVPLSLIHPTTGVYHDGIVFGTNERVTVKGGAVDGGVALRSLSGDDQFRVNDTGVGFYGNTCGAQPDITGSRDSNPALADLLTKLAALGLITDSSGT
jgi:hypothetical protein